MKTCNKGYKVMIELEKKELVYDIKNTAFALQTLVPIRKILMPSS